MWRVFVCWTAAAVMALVVGMQLFQHGLTSPVIGLLLGTAFGVGGIVLGIAWDEWSKLRP